MPQVAMITGASRGIGYALTLDLVARGVNVIAIARNQNKLEKLRATNPSKITIIPADITTDEGLQKILHGLQDTRIDFLINNAATIKPIGLLQHSADQEIEQLIKTNLLAQIFLTNKAIPFFANRGGRILNITSVASSAATPGIMPYCISKAGLDIWTEGLNKELPSHIIAGKVIPGEVATPMQGDLREAPLDRFPLAAEFIEAEKQKTLIPAADCAKFLGDVLLKTTNELFVSKTWNIYRDYAGVIPQPLNQKKLAQEQKPEYSITAISHFGHRLKSLAEPSMQPVQNKLKSSL